MADWVRSLMGVKSSKYVLVTYAPRGHANGLKEAQVTTKLTLHHRTNRFIMEITSETKGWNAVMRKHIVRYGGCFVYHSTKREYRLETRQLKWEVHKEAGKKGISRPPWVRLEVVKEKSHWIKANGEVKCVKQRYFPLNKYLTGDTCFLVLTFLYKRVPTHFHLGGFIEHSMDFTASISQKHVLQVQYPKIDISRGLKSTLHDDEKLELSGKHNDHLYSEWLWQNGQMFIHWNDDRAWTDRHLLIDEEDDVEQKRAYMNALIDTAHPNGAVNGLTNPKTDPRGLKNSKTFSFEDLETTRTQSKSLSNGDDGHTVLRNGAQTPTSQSEYED